MQIDNIRVRETLVMDAAEDRVRRTSDGYLVARPRVARTGIQLYGGAELGKPDMKVVRVYRPPDEVMHKDAMASLAHKPITSDHPGEAVTADNWKKYAVGHVGDEIARDGEFIRVPMMLSDAATIADFYSGKKELSLGYNARLEWRSGKTEDGQEYDAVQTNIRINHLAVVDAARGGPKLAIGDDSSQQSTIDKARSLIDGGKVERKAKMPSETKDSANVLSLRSADPGLECIIAKDGILYRDALQSIKATAEKQNDKSLSDAAVLIIALIDAKQKGTKMSELKLQSLTVDSISVEVTDTAAQVINRSLQQRDAKIAELQSKLSVDAGASKATLDTANSQVATLTATNATKDAEIATLKKQLDDAKITPAKLDELVKNRHEVIGKARVKMGDKLVVDGKTEGEIRRQVVDAVLGEQAKGWDDVMVNASFATLTADVKPEQLQGMMPAADHMARTFSGNPARPGGYNGAAPHNDGGVDPYVNYNNRISQAWKGDQPKQ